MYGSKEEEGTVSVKGLNLKEGRSRQDLVLVFDFHFPLMQYIHT